MRKAVIVTVVALTSAGAWAQQRQTAPACDPDNGGLTLPQGFCASVYADKAGGDLTAWRDAMAAESWYSAEEAVESGLADRVDTRKTADKAKNKFDLSIFTYAGRDEAPAPHASDDPAPSEDATDPDDAPETPPEPAADEDALEPQLVASVLEHLAHSI